MSRNQLLGMGLLVALGAGPSLAWGEEPDPKSVNDLLRREIEALESQVRRLKADLDEARAAAVQAKIQADAFEFRCQKLQEELDANRPASSVRDPKVQFAVRTKPAPAVAQGKITGIAKDGRMLQVSLGADSGIKEGRVLEVYRLPTSGSAKPLYLGTVTLTRVDLQAALGEFKNATGSDHRPKIGDEVATEFIVK